MAPNDVTTSSAVAWPAPVDPNVLDLLRIVYVFFTKYVWMIIVFFGLLGNFISIAITLQKENRRISTCNYMTALALADTSTLLEYGWSMAVVFWGTDPPSQFTSQ
jgi:hypothetical protein